MSSRDWVLNILHRLDEVLSVDPHGEQFIRISRERHPSFSTAIISERNVSKGVVDGLVATGEDFQFIANIPKQAVWLGDAIAVPQDLNIGWGGIGDLMSAIGLEYVNGFQRKEYAFVERGLRQHNRVARLTRIYDRVFKISRHRLSDITVALVYEYELTAEHVRSARETYGAFDAILKTNPNGRTTAAALDVADQLGICIFSWGGFLSRLHKP